MTDTFATSARPRTAAIAWASKDSIYCEIPCRGGPPYIIREKLSVNGLARVLSILVENQEPAPPPPQFDHPAVRKAGKKPEVTWASEKDRESARAALRKFGLLKE